MIDGQNFFDQPIRNNLKTYNVQKIVADRRDDYTIGCLLDHNYLENYYHRIALDISKQQALDSDPKAIQQINFTRNLEEQ